MTNLLPRLATSLKSTAVPKDFLAKVRGVFEKQFEIEADTGEFIAEGLIFPEEVVLRVGYIEKGRLKQINFEASMDIKKAKLADADAETTATGTMERLYTLIDVLGSLMEEYFQADQDEAEMDVPLHWKEYEFEGETVFMQYSTVNTRLEEEADRILGLIADELVKESKASEDALAKAEIDSELAFDVQKAIRSGKYKLNPDGSFEIEPNEEELN
jgi:hypothetical protein